MKLLEILISCSKFEVDLYVKKKKVFSKIFLGAAPDFPHGFTKDAKKTTVS